MSTSASCGYCGQSKKIDAWCNCWKAQKDKKWFEQHLKECQSEMSIRIRREEPLGSKNNNVITTCDVCEENFGPPSIGAIVIIDNESTTLCPECYQLHKGS